jgi:hypothetical protein
MRLYSPPGRVRFDKYYEKFIGNSLPSYRVRTEATGRRNMVQTLSMRTKLLMALLTLTVSVALMAVTADTANAQVTTITSVYNYTNKEIYIWNHESGKRIEIAPAGDRPTRVGFNEWVPWAWTADHFGGPLHRSRQRGDVL